MNVAKSQSGLDWTGRGSRIHLSPRPCHTIVPGQENKDNSDFEICHAVWWLQRTYCQSLESCRPPSVRTSSRKQAVVQYTTWVFRIRYSPASKLRTPNHFSCFAIFFCSFRICQSHLSSSWIIYNICIGDFHLFLCNTQLTEEGRFQPLGLALPPLCSFWPTSHYSPK